MGIVFGSSGHECLNTATVYGASRLGCLRLYNRIIGRMIEGQDGCSVPKVGAHIKKVEYRLRKYWIALQDKNVCLWKLTLC